MYSYFEPIYMGNNLRGPQLYGLSHTAFLVFSTELMSGKYVSLFDKYKDVGKFILSCKIIPFNVNHVYAKKSAIRFADEISGISAYVRDENVTSTLAEFNFNRDDLDNILSNSFVDYNSFSSYTLYLPFVGFVDLSYDTIKSCDLLNIDYYVDYSTCTMFCNVTISYGTYNVRIYENSVNVGHDLPMLVSDNTSYYAGLISAIGTIVTVGGVLLGNPLVTTAGVSTTATSVPAVNNTTTYRALNPNTNRMRNYSQTINHSDPQTTKSTNKWKYSSYGNKYSATGELINGVSHFISSSSSQQCLSSSTNTSLLNFLRRPYIMYKHPTTNYFNGYDHMYGRPLSQYKVLSSMSGYTKLSSIHLNIPATTSELEEIESLLYEGVIINNDTPSPEPPVNPEPPVEPEPEPEPDPEPPTPEPDPEPPTPEPDPEPPEEYRPYEEGKEMICCFNGRFRVTSPRGWRTLNGVRDYHKGIDLVGEDSHVVYAICDGYCTTRTQYNDEGKMDGFGHYVTQTIADGRRVFYAHLASFSITDNQYVTAGTPIGIMGATGNVTGAHTHLELRPAGTTSESLDINAFTGIPNVVGNYTGVPTYKVEGSAELQAKVGLENQTMEYLNNYEYAEDLVRKLNDKIE